MKKYKFIFWDMDGTLANTYEGVTNCVKYAMEPYGIHLEGEEKLRKFIGPPLRFSFTTYCGRNLDIPQYVLQIRLHGSRQPPW